MKAKLTRLAVGLVIMAAIFTQNPKTAYADEIISEESVVVVKDITTTADANTDETMNSIVVLENSSTDSLDEDSTESLDENSEEVEITINDEETPLYAGNSTEISYLLYCWIVCFGVALILGGVYLFQKKHN